MKKLILILLVLSVSFVCFADEVITMESAEVVGEVEVVEETSEATEVVEGEKISIGEIVAGIILSLIFLIIMVAFFCGCKDDGVPPRFIIIDLVIGWILLGISFYIVLVLFEFKMASFLSLIFIIALAYAFHNLIREFIFIRIWGHPSPLDMRNWLNKQREENDS